MLLAASQILAEYRRRTPNSAKLAEQARELFPGGVTHDARLFQPYPIFVERAAGSRKWDVDGNEYVDYFGGHGALLLGHCHPQVTEAVQRQLVRGTHYGACHELELQWGEIVRRLIPSAQRLRFTSSGTEATLLALRLARAHTGRAKVVRFAAHFHGWQDHVAFGVASHHDGTPTPGVLAEVARQVLLCPPGNIEALRELLSREPDVAAVIVEPTGASFGQIPLQESFLHQLRDLTRERGTLLIFDEVVTGFRCSPGGAQALFGIQPDLTTLAKILAGGLPGGSVVGRRDILDWLDPQACAAAGREKISHQGTFNANPLSAAAGVSALEIVAQTDACQRANDYAARLREALARVLREENVPWCAYGTFSVFHLYTNPSGEEVSAQQIESGAIGHQQIKAAAGSEMARKLRLGMLVRGVDMLGWPGGPTSAVHGDEDLERTADALRQTLRIMKREGDL